MSEANSTSVPSHKKMPLAHRFKLGDLVLQEWSEIQATKPTYSEYAESAAQKLGFPVIASYVASVVKARELKWPNRSGGGIAADRLAGVIAEQTRQKEVQRVIVRALIGLAAGKAIKRELTDGEMILADAAATK